jgi:hypothetical protein
MASEIIRTYFYEPAKPAKKESFIPDLTEAEEHAYRIQMALRYFLPDGTIHLIEHHNEDNRINCIGVGLEPDNIRILNTDMEEIWTGKEEDNPYRYIDDDNKYPRSVDRNIQRWLRDKQSVTVDFKKAFVVPVVTGEGKVLIRWVYSLTDRYFTGYDSEGFVIGYFGINGFVEGKEQVAAFGEFGCTRAIVSSGRQRSPVLTWKTPRKIYEIDLAKRTIETLIESKDEDIKFVVDLRYGKPSTNYWSESKAKEKPQGYRPAISAVTAPGKCYTLLQEPERRVTFQIPKEWIKEYWPGKGDRLGATITVFEDEIYLRPSGSNRPVWNRKIMPVDEYFAMLSNKSYHSWTELYKLDPSGQIEQLSRFEWDRLPGIKTNGPDTYNQYSGMSILKKLTVASPILYTGIYKIVGKFSIQNWENINPIFRDIIGATTEYLRPIYILPTLILSVMMAAVTFWHGWPRRQQPSGFAFWIIFVFVFNVTGLLTYLALNHVTVIRCSKCGKRRHIMVSQCSACGQPLEEPAAKPTDLVMTG